MQQVKKYISFQVEILKKNRYLPEKATASALNPETNSFTCYKFERKTALKHDFSNFSFSTALQYWTSLNMISTREM